MKPTNREDTVVIRMAIEVLLESVRQSEEWWRVYGDTEAVRGVHQLAKAIHSTRKRLFGEVSSSSSHITKALIVAEGLREAALHCDEGQAALCARLTNGAEAIERLCSFVKALPQGPPL